MQSLDSGCQIIGRYIFNLSHQTSYILLAICFDDLFQMLTHPLRKNRSINLTTVLTGQFANPFTQTPT
ncbi:MAG: hypothetical protein RMX68_022945 [Aulosira sp. ZfuVER01]|nr:hypothetical protein [Aulosira sp. DedVER01a]MDZ8050997.1 hypothetical protein [Aulosira sp. ZfuCHP01]